jgi:hypothetical protein
MSLLGRVTLSTRIRGVVAESTEAAPLQGGDPCGVASEAALHGRSAPSLHVRTSLELPRSNGPGEEGRLAGVAVSVEI